MHIAHIAFRHLTHYRARSLILGACIALTFLFPLTVEWLVESHTAAWSRRAAATPLVLGAKGSRYDLVLNTLYFRGRIPSSLPHRELEKLREGGLADAIPIVARTTAGHAPIVGTTPDYFDHHRLRVVVGELPKLIGEAVVGASVAAEQDLVPGDHILSDQKNLYDISEAYPLRMRVVGVLAPADSADDDAVFVDLKTAWIVEGIGHGHGDATEQGPESVLSKDDERIVLDDSVHEYREITPENIETFHFHGGLAELPLTGVLVVPHDQRSRTMLRARYRVSDTAQLLEPATVVAEIQGFVYQLKRFFDANTATVLGATLLFLFLIVLLSIRVRGREVETLAKIGAARSAIVQLFLIEFAIIVTAGLVTASLLATLISAFAIP